MWFFVKIIQNFANFSISVSLCQEMGLDRPLTLPPSSSCIDDLKSLLHPLLTYHGLQDFWTEFQSNFIVHPASLRYLPWFPLALLGLSCQNSSCPGEGSFESKAGAKSRHPDSSVLALALARQASLRQGWRHISLKRNARTLNSVDRKTTTCPYKYCWKRTGWSPPRF